MSQKLDWRPHGGVAAVVNKKGRRLMLIAGQSDRDGWNLLAVEGPGGTPTAEEVFDNHAHDAVANDVPLEIALRLGETYADAWLAGDQEALDKCKCPTIRAPEMGPEGEGEGELEADAPVAVRPDRAFADEDIVMRCDGNCSVCRSMSIPELVRTVRGQGACMVEFREPNPDGIPPCKGCLEPDREHDWGVTCKASETLSPFHLHLEKCEQCREHPFALCTKGLTLLQDEA